ncbi:MAG: hypothetical protein RL557_112 [archaeon]|jgi:hypothetical protein
MESEKRTSLERKLQTIQELKREKYIGTQEAWKYLERVTALDENPSKLAYAINKAMQMPVRYEATPHRILGFNYTFNGLVATASVNEVKDKELSDFYNFLIDKSPLCDPFILSHRRKMSIYFVNAFTEVFMAMNDDESIAYKETEERDAIFSALIIAREMSRYNADNRVRTNFYHYYSSINWSQCFSVENLREIEKELKRRVYTYEIDLKRRIKRMFDDLVDHRLENRREILTDFLDESLSHSPHCTYDEIVGNVKRRLSIRRKRLQDLLDIDSNEVIVNNEREMIRESEFQLHLLTSDKKFIQKYLRS